MTHTSPTLADVIRRALETSAADLHVSMPGRVERFDAAKGLADVKPLLRDGFDDDGTRRTVSAPVITNVPVVFPGAGGFRLTFPVAQGDGCLLVFTDRSLDRWLARGGEIDPGDDRRHAISDAVALLGLRDFAHPWSGVAADAATIGKDGGEQIVVRSGEILLGAGATETAVLGKALKQHLAAVKTWLDALQLPCQTPAGPGTAGPPAVESPIIPQIESTIVKVKG
jgi:hypothetical protein